MAVKVLSILWTYLLVSIILPLSVLSNPIVDPVRPTFGDLSTSIAGKIVLEEHIASSLFNPASTTPYENNTTEIPFFERNYVADVFNRLTVGSIEERVRQMDISNISISVVSIAPPGIQGFFNKTLAIQTSPLANDEMYANYTAGKYPTRFKHWCTAALQDPVSAAKEVKRCVKKLHGVGVMVGPYTNNGSVNEVVYLDHAINEPFWKMVESLKVPVYLHPRESPPSQQGVYAGYEFLAGAEWGFSAETGATVLRMMVSGLFDRYPNLQIVLGHCGEGLPFFLARIDQRLRHLRPEFMPAKQTMRCYWENNFYVTTAGVQDEAALIDTLRVSGEDRVMFSVDYPFEDNLELSKWFDGLEMNVDTKKKIAFKNAKKLLAI